MAQGGKLIEFAVFDYDHAANSAISEQGGFKVFNKLKPWGKGQTDHEGGIRLLPIQNNAVREAVRNQAWADTFAQRRAKLLSEITGPQQLMDPGGGIRQIRGPRQRWEA